MRVTFPYFGSLAGSFNTHWHKRSILFDYDLLITGVVTWKECLSEAVIWDTFTWFASLIAISGYLNKYGLISWLSQTVVKTMQDVYLNQFLFAIFNTGNGKDRILEGMGLERVMSEL
ncbi:dicarboxylate transporter 1, chloroplastic [Artemisia annua]|uniref:Dicarboxylate transporter 1, chloroplastic n=1 Tax=Artemisia annua TaxID=35608 RepID=A0A2U1QA93_ARTAN|nr:dicarboxylate transporter 1, chloroplastic [Artemisia annua]